MANITVDDIVKKCIYYCQIKDVFPSFEDYMDQLDEQNKLMTETEFKKLLTGLLRFPRYSVITRDYNYDFLNRLTKRHAKLFTPKYIEMFVPKLNNPHLGKKLPKKNVKCAVKNKAGNYDPEPEYDDSCHENCMCVWVNNLIKVGYKFTDEQRVHLIELKCNTMIDTTYENKEYDIIHKAIFNLCSVKYTFDFEYFKKLIEKTHLIPNTQQFISWFDNSNEYKLNDIYDRNKNATQKKSIEIIKTFIKYGLKMTPSIANRLCKYYDVKVEFSAEIETMFKNAEYFDGMIEAQDENHDDKQLTTLADFTIYKYNIMKYGLNNIEYIIDLALEYKLKPCDNIYCLLATKMVKKMNEIPARYVNGTMPKNLDIIYNNIIDKLLGSGLYPFTNKSIESACAIGDELLYDKIISYNNNSIKIDANQVYLEKAIIGDSNNIVESLLNMKLIPTSNMVQLIKPSDGSMLQLLIQYGLPIDFDVVEKAMQNNIYIDHLDEYAIPYDNKLYELSYKYDKINNGNCYIEKLRANPEVHYKLREMIRTNIKKNSSSKIIPESELIEAVRKENFVDYMIYNDAVKNGFYELVKFLENEFGCTPNFEALMLINDRVAQGTYYDRIMKYLADNNIILPPNVLRTDAIIKQVEKEPEQELEPVPSLLPVSPSVNLIKTKKAVSKKAVSKKVLVKGPKLSKIKKNID